MKGTLPKNPGQIETEGRLQQHWLGFWQKVGASGDPRFYFQELVERYSEPHRFYHTLKHIDHCLAELGLVRNLAVNPDAIEMAIWYHDVIYDRATDNEEKSADFAVKTAHKIGLQPDFASEVSRLILVTKHLSAPVDNDGRLLVDIDIAILGQPPSAFDQYEDDIRKEHSYMDDVSFAKGRSAVVKLFSDRERVYLTDFFRDRYEEQTRTNLVKSISRWAG